MEQAKKLLPLLFVLALIFAMAAPRLLMAEEEKSVTIPDLADLIPLAAQLSGGLAILEKQDAAGLDLSAVEIDLSRIVANLDKHIVQLARLEAAGISSYRQLVELEGAVESEADSLEKVNKRINREIRKLGTSRKEWLSEKKRWSEWESALLKDEPIDKVKLTFAKAHKAIDTALNLIRHDLEPLLKVQEEAGNIQTRIISFAAEIDGLILARRGGILVESYPPMLSSRYFSQFGGELLYGVQRGLARVSLPGERFFAREGWIVLLQGLLSLAFIIVIYRKRQVLKDSKRWQFTAGRPFSAGIFFGVMSAFPFYEYGGMPVTWKLALAIVIGISSARLVGGLIEASWKRQFVYGFIIVFIFTWLFYVVSLPLPLFRLCIVLMALVGLLLFLRWAGESARRGEPVLYNWALRLASFLFVVVIIAELWGKAGLAEYLFISSIRTIANLLAFWMFMYLVRGGLDWAFRNSPLQRITLLRSNADAIIRRVSLLFDVVVGAYLLSVILVIWEVYDSVSEAMEALLSFGFNLGSQRITVSLVMASAGLLYGSFLISWIIQRVLMDEVLAKRGVEAGVQLSVSRLIHYALILTGFLLALLALGFELTKLTIIVSALGVGIGFGLQSVVNNFVCGLIMLFERPVRVGDYIELGGRWAEIKDIGLRATLVRTFDSADIVVPNSNLITNEVTNWTLSDRIVRLIIPVGVAYGSDVKLVTETLIECTMANSEVLKMPEPQVLFRRFGESSLDFELRVWISKPDKRLRVESDLHYDIDQRFREAGIEIAFQQMDLHIRRVDESPGSILEPPEDQRPDLLVIPRKGEDEEDERDQ